MTVLLLALAAQAAPPTDSLSLVVIGDLVDARVDGAIVSAADTTTQVGGVGYLDPADAEALAVLADSGIVTLQIRYDIDDGLVLYAWGPGGSWTAQGPDIRCSASMSWDGADDREYMFADVVGAPVDPEGRTTQIRSNATNVHGRESSGPVLGDSCQLTMPIEDPAALALNLRSSAAVNPEVRLFFTWNRSESAGIRSFVGVERTVQGWYEEQEVQLGNPFVDLYGDAPRPNGNSGGNGNGNANGQGQGLDG